MRIVHETSFGVDDDVSLAVLVDTSMACGVWRLCQGRLVDLRRARGWSRLDLGLLEILKHRVDHLESLVDFLAHLGASEDDLAADKDEEHNLGLEHAVDQAREEFRLVRAEVVMARGKTFQADWELDVARTDNVLDLEVGELGVEAKFLDDACILARGKFGVIFRLGASHHHLARSKDEGCGLGVANAHDDGGETLWVVLCVARVQSDRLEIQAAIKIDRGNDVSFVPTCEPRVLDKTWSNKP
jgi:hypothetical protein